MANLNGIITLLAIGVSTFFINLKPPLSLVQEVYLDELTAKASGKLKASLSVNDNLCQKSVFSVPHLFDDYLKVMSISLFVAHFNLLSCKSDNFKSTL